MCGSGTQTTLLCAIGAVRVFTVLEIETDLVEALFGHKVIVLAKISTVNDCVDELAWI